MNLKEFKTFSKELSCFLVYNGYKKSIKEFQKLTSLWIVCNNTLRDVIEVHLDSLFDKSYDIQRKIMDYMVQQ